MAAERPRTTTGGARRPRPSPQATRIAFEKPRFAATKEASSMATAPSSTPASEKKKTEITVLYNGTTREIAYQANQQVNALLQHALNEFGVHANRHLMSLFTLA